MKTIEDKAKAYDEALDRMKHVVIVPENEKALQALKETIFPELRESEDERIRKKIIDIVKAAPFDEEKDVLLAYLEKQEQNSDDVKREWWNKGYLEGRKNAHIPARELGLPSSWDFQKEQKPIEFKNDELVEIIKGEFEGFRTLLKKKGIDYEPQRGYWEGFARHFYELGKQSKQPVSEGLETEALRSAGVLLSEHFEDEDDDAIRTTALRCWKGGVIHGASWQKEQMMKEAVTKEGKFQRPSRDASGLGYLEISTLNTPFKEGDEVIIQIRKKES